MSAKNGHEITFSANFKSYFSLTSTNYEQDLNIHFGRRFFFAISIGRLFLQHLFSFKAKGADSLRHPHSLKFNLSDVEREGLETIVFILDNCLGVTGLKWTFVFIATYFIYNTKYFTQLEL